MSLRFLTAGESHGPALTGILEGLPAGLEVSVAALTPEMQRRKRGFGRGARQQIETDDVQIVGGVRLGRTLGSPIALFLANRDWQSWQQTMRIEPLPAGAPAPDRQVRVPRPGHADRVGAVKYGHDDMRNVLERSSARETAMRVALGTVARLFLQALDVHIGSRIVAIGAVEDPQPRAVPARELNAKSDASPVRCVHAPAEADMVAAIAAAKERGDTLGGVFEVVADNLPIGLGSYAQWDRRLEADIGRALLSLNAIKGVEVGHGFRAARAHGSDTHDSLQVQDGQLGYASNRAGGLEGGMTNGQPLWVRAAMKPLATLMQALPSVDVQSRTAAKAHTERSDVCAAPSAAVVAESLLALVLADAILKKFGGDSMNEVQGRVRQWREHCCP
jgi:chorismate synthase